MHLRLNLFMHLYCFINSLQCLSYSYEYCSEALQFIFVSFHPYIFDNLVL